MKLWLLTDKEIRNAYWKYGTVKKTPEARAKQVAKAQVKVVVELLDELNLQYDTHNKIYGLLLDNEDWQLMRKEVGLKEIK